MEEKDINVNNMMFGYKMFEITQSRLLKNNDFPKSWITRPGFKWLLWIAIHKFWQKKILLEKQDALL